jgi:hypothetical protein
MVKIGKIVGYNSALLPEIKAILKSYKRMIFRFSEIKERRIFEVHNQPSLLLTK